jgi:endonuclease YncB( thermonuclease family)
VIYTVPARIARVINGDSLRCDLDLGWGVWMLDEPIRLARINAPELGTPAGEDAKIWLTTNTASQREGVFVSSGFDKYRRALGEFQHPKLGNLSDALLAAGYARLYP